MLAEMSSSFGPSSEMQPSQQGLVRVIVEQFGLPHDLPIHSQCNGADLSQWTISSPAHPADDNAPPESKSKWLAIFYLCIPVGETPLLSSSSAISFLNRYILSP